MTELARRKNLTIKSSLVLLLLIATGFLGNYFSVSLFFGVDFLFGSIAVLLVLYFYGLGWGMLAAVVANSFTWFFWGLPYEFITCTSEALVVGMLLQGRRHNLVLADGLFWLGLGMPLAWLFHGVVMHLDATTTTFIMLKQGINGIFNALMANLVISYLPFSNLLESPQFSGENSLRGALFNLLVIMVVVPGLLAAIFEARNTKERLEAELAAELQTISTGLTFHLNSWVQQHMRVVEELAKQTTTHSLLRIEQLQQEANILKQPFPELGGLHVENAAGRTLVFSPPVNKEGKSNIGLDLSDRLWFKESKAKQQPLVSDVFLGRTAHAGMPLVVVTAPVFLHNRWAGTAAGSLDLVRLQDLLKIYSNLGSKIAITLTDSKNNVVAGTRPEPKPMQVWDGEKNGTLRRLNASMEQWLPDDPKLAMVTRWRQSLIVHKVSLRPGLDWNLTLEASLAPIQQSLFTVYTKNLTVTGILIVLALLFSLFISRWLTRPLAQLSRITADIPKKLSEAPSIDWPTSSYHEINSLIVNSRFMVNTLEENFHNLLVQSDELWEFNHELNREIKKRQQAENRLEKSLSLHKATLESTTDGILVAEPDGHMSSWNQKFVRMWNVPETVMTSKDDGEALTFVLQQLKSPETFLARIQEIYVQPEAESYDVIELKDGRTFERYSQPQRLGENVVGRVWSFRDITKRQQTEEALRQAHEELEMRVQERTAELSRVNEVLQMEISQRQRAEGVIKAALQEKEMLLKEIHHRTKNNMQVVCSLLRLQSSRLGDSQLLRALQDSENRVRAMALVHEKLYQSQDLSHIDLKDYIKDITYFLLTAYQAASERITLNLDLHSAIVNIETATPCGLIINELISNALKYAFPGLQKGMINILLREIDKGDIELRIADDGVGLPPELDLWRTDSLGLKLVTTLTKNQLNGKLEVQREQGTAFLINFREQDYKPRI